jgi:hypothetical protein
VQKTPLNADSQKLEIGKGGKNDEETHHLGLGFCTRPGISQYRLGVQEVGQ